MDSSSSNSNSSSSSSSSNSSGDEAAATTSPRRTSPNSAAAAIALTTAQTSCPEIGSLHSPSTRTSPNGQQQPQQHHHHNSQQMAIANSNSCSNNNNNVVQTSNIVAGSNAATTMASNLLDAARCQSPDASSMTSTGGIGGGGIAGDRSPSPSSMDRPPSSRSSLGATSVAPARAGDKAAAAVSMASMAAAANLLSSEHGLQHALHLYGQAGGHHHHHGHHHQQQQQQHEQQHHHGHHSDRHHHHHQLAPPSSSSSSAAAATSAALLMANVNDPSANECKLIDYRGAKVAAFVVAGDTMLCLPQAFELFLKHLVGGLHTVYTKLKRLDITPIVCNVEQVRILRGLGAIQPGVNRCKLLSCKDFDVLYKDCTTASSRPGRPPKRVSLLGNASQETLLKLKKSRMDNGEYQGYENGHIAAHLLKGLQGSIDPMMLFPLITGELRMEKSPLLSNGYNQPPTHINPLPFMALNHHHGHSGHSGNTAILSPNTTTAGNGGGGSGGTGAGSGNGGTGGISSSHHHHHHHHHHSSRSDGSVIIKERNAGHANDVLQARLKEDKVDCGRTLLEHRVRDLCQYNGSPNGHSPVLNLSQKNLSGGGGGGGGGGGAGNQGDHSGSEAALNDQADDDDNISDVDDEDEKDQDLSDCPDVTSTANGDRSSMNLQGGQALSYSALMGDGCGGGGGGGGSGGSMGSVSSIETLLRNIQGLLKVAADNARQQERQINYEKAELKMEILREREVRENLEKQLVDDQRTRVLYQKRLKKEKRARRRLQDQLELEVKRRVQYEEALKNTSADTLRLLNESLSQDLEADRSSRTTDTERKLQDARVYYKNPVLFSSAT